MSARVLLAVTVYNGQATVPDCLRSVARLTVADGIDALVLDDASPAPGFSEEVSDLCAELGLTYYCTPRNLGIPRNVNLGMRAAVEGGYDHVVICNSDIIVPADLVVRLLGVYGSDPTIGSVTALSNNVSAYSLPNTDSGRYLADQGVVDWLSACLAGEFGDTAIDIPAGISFCMLVPTPVIEAVGLMDTVYGRGYCEETDWTQRSRAAGYRITLAPGTFVYHRGQGSTADAGMLSSGHTTVPANERIVAHRYPLFNIQVDGFLRSSILPTLHRNAVRRMVHDAARAYGWTLHVSWLAGAPADTDMVRVTVQPDVPGEAVRVSFRGFSTTVDLAGRPIAAALHDEFGGPPRNVDVFDRGALSDELATAGIGPVNDHYSYPERI